MQVYVMRVSEDSTRMILGDLAELMKAIVREIADTEDAGVMTKEEGGMTLLIHREEMDEAEFKRIQELDFPGW